MKKGLHFSSWKRLRSVNSDVQCKDTFRMRLWQSYQLGNALFSVIQTGDRNTGKVSLFNFIYIT